MQGNELKEISAKQVVFDDKRTLEEVIRDIVSKIEPVAAETITEEGETS